MAKPVYVSSQTRPVLGVHRQAGEVVPGVADLPSREIQRLLRDGVIELDERLTAQDANTDVVDGGGP